MGAGGGLAGCVVVCVVVLVSVFSDASAQSGLPWRQCGRCLLAQVQLPLDIPHCVKAQQDISAIL